MQEEPAVRGVGAYLGGHPNEIVTRGGVDGKDIEPLQGHLETSTTGIYLAPHRPKGGLPRRAVVPWTDVVYVSIESYRESKGRLGPVLRGSVQPESTVLAVHLRSGGIVYYQAHLNFQAFRANVTPILHSLGVTVSDGAPVASAAPAPTISVADELAKLAQLRDSGVLTEAEFATQKAKLLG